MRAAAKAAIVDSGDAAVVVGEFLADLGLGNGVRDVRELGFLFNNPYLFFIPPFIVYYSIDFV